MKNIKILLAIPVYQYCETETMKSIYELKVPAGVTMDLYFQKGYTIAHARNEIVKKSLKEKYDYTFFVDSDMLIPDYSLQVLLEMNVPIASGWYVKKLPGQSIPEIFIKNDKGTMEIKLNVPKNKIIEVNGAGFGCILIDNNVFKKAGTTHTWFNYVYEETQKICSEDIYFCKKAEENGFKILIHTKVMCGHIGQAMYVPSSETLVTEEKIDNK